MIVSVNPLPIGNALRIQLAPPPSADVWRLLRNATDVFTDENDPASVLVAETATVDVIVDAIGLANGTIYYYKAWYWDGEQWLTDSSSSQGTPQANYFDVSTDALTLVRDRLDYGIQCEIAAGRLTAPQNGGGKIAVLSAPPIFDETPFPVVVVHLNSESPSVHGIGELIDSNQLNTDGSYSDNQGWLAKTVIDVTGWALNPDVRIALRKSLRRLVIGNLDVFYAAGFREVDFSQTDQDDLNGTYGAPVYFTTGSFSCLSPILVGGSLRPVADVEVNIEVESVPLTLSVSLGSN